MRPTATAGALAALLFYGCAAVPALPRAPGEFHAAWPGAPEEPAGGRAPAPAAAPRDEAGRTWTAFASLSAWSLSTDGRSSNPSASGGGPEGDGESLSVRVGVTFDILRDARAGPDAKGAFDWVPEGWRPCWGVEAEYLRARSEGSGTDDPSLEARSVELLLPLGLRRPASWWGDDGHRFDLLLGGALRSLDLEDGDLAAVGADDSPSVGSLVVGVRGRVALGSRLFLFARGDLGGLVVHDDSGSGSDLDESDTGHAQWRAGIGVRVAPGISVQAGWRSLVIERSVREALAFRQNPNAVVETHTRVGIEGAYLEVEIRF